MIFRGMPQTRKTVHGKIWYAIVTNYSEDRKALVHSYRALQKWDQWLAQQFLGKSLLTEERQLFDQLLKHRYGKHALLIGVPQQQELLRAADIPFHSLLSPFSSTDQPTIESDFHELPILTGSSDVVILPHTLEVVDNPRQLLAEACRIVKPEGLIIICGFNPYSIWGMRKWPWGGNFIQARAIKYWLGLADFVLEHQKFILFRPPINHPSLYQKLRYIEHIGKKCFPILGGVYILLARAKVIPLTPIRMKWKQHLSGIRISPTIPGHIARQSK